MPKKLSPSDKLKCYRNDEAQNFVCFGTLFGLYTMEIVPFDTPRGQQMLKDWDKAYSKKLKREVVL